MTDYFKILNLTPDASLDEIEEAYRTLRQQYSEERFMEGEAGKQGAIKLTQLEEAYKEIIRQKKDTAYNGGGSLSEADRLIKAGDLNGAQRELDKITERPAEWHFLQSIIFYKRGWMEESRTQLRLAVNMDPANVTYSTSLNKLEQVMASGNANPYTMGNNQNPPPQQQPVDPSMGVGNCCTTLCLMDLCCNMMRCCG